MAARSEQATTIVKGDTAANLASSNPLLWYREMMHETDTGRIKFGNGVDHWNDLPYSGSEHDAEATTTTKGLLSPEDKAKLDTIEENANNYSLPIASADTLGGIKIGENLSISADGKVSANVVIATGTSTGDGNVITSIEVDANNKINVVKGITAITDISGKADKVNITAGETGTSTSSQGASLSIPYIKVNAQGIVTEYGNRIHNVTGFASEDHNHDNSYYTKTEVDSKLTTAGTVKTVNNTAPDENGNISITISDPVTVTDSYSATSSNAMSGVAVASAISPLQSDIDDLKSQKTTMTVNGEVLEITSSCAVIDGETLSITL